MHLFQRTAFFKFFLCWFLVFGFICPEALLAEWLDNVWPLYTVEKDEHTEESTRLNIAGPIFSRTYAYPTCSYALRPIYAQFHNQEDDIRDHYFFYPLVRRHTTPHRVSWSFFNLLQASAEDYDDPKSKKKNVRLFPFYSFVGAPESESTPKHSVFPVAGGIEHIFGVDQLSWFMFPVFAKAQKNDIKRYYFLWPIIRAQKGEHAGGGGLWPLYSHMYEEGKYDKKFFLWPFYYHNWTQLDREVPTERRAFLPFFALSRSQKSESYTALWPFFGYTNVYEPPYHEKRFFWPLLVQGRGEKKFINRWAPLYTHSSYGNNHKWWFLWPSCQVRSWEDSGLQVEHKKFFYAVVSSQTQQSLENESSEIASKHHIWPLISAWDSGAGEKQFQFFSPLEPLFPHNRVIREVYTPFFALYRYHQREPGWSYYSILFNLLTLQTSPDRAQFDFGPIISIEKGGPRSGFQVFKGLLGFYREGDKKVFKFLWFKV